MNRLLMIPALGCDGDLYREVAAMLSPLVSCQTVVCAEDNLAGCVSAVLAAADGPFIVMGTSVGGRVALETALAAPQRVQGLVVIGAGAGPVADPAAGLRRSARLRGGEFAAVVQEMAAIIAHPAGPRGAATSVAFASMCDRQGAELMARQSDALARRGDRWPRVVEINCPALMLWGVLDQFSPAADGRRLAAAVAHGRSVELADCGHFPTLEYPAQSAAAIAAWLGDSGLG
jgi:pimeloyl-ACP methyl ester carboxylesterase